MKHIILLFLLAISMLAAPGVSFAGFRIHKQHATTATQHGQVEKMRNLREAAHAKFASFSPGSRYYTYHARNQWYGIAAIVSGVLGIFIPGFYLLAILFGVLGMGRGCDAQGLAIAGFLMGLGELAIFLATTSTLLALIFF